MGFYHVSFVFLLILASIGSVFGRSLQLGGPSQVERREYFESFSSTLEKKDAPAVGPFVRGLSMGTPYQQLQKIAITTTSAELLIFSGNFTKPIWTFNETASDTFEYMNDTYSNTTDSIDGRSQQLNGRICMESFQFSHEIAFFQDFIVYFALIDSAENQSVTYPGSDISGIMGLGFAPQVSPHMDVAAMAFLNDQDYSKGVTLNFYSCDQQDVQQTVGLFNVGGSLDSEHCQQESYFETEIFYPNQWSFLIESITFGSYHSNKAAVAKLNIAELGLGVPEELYSEFVTQFQVDPKQKFPIIDCDLDFDSLQLNIGNSTVKYSSSIYIDKVSTSPPTCRLIAYPVKATGFQNAWIFGYSLVVDKCLFLGWDRQVLGFADAKTSNC